MDSYNKYLKYKQKYLQIKNSQAKNYQSGGGDSKNSCGIYQSGGTLNGRSLM